MSYTPPRPPPKFFRVFQFFLTLYNIGTISEKKQDLFRSNEQLWHFQALPYSAAH